ncbi:MAG: class I lanthipeptide [Candidatus Aminicenantes bacterium]|nr:class I lanthipeptide [Candidatus Aminicenantes bacterium]
MVKKLELKKETIARLTPEELSEIKAGYKACWENLWSLYYCGVIWTGDVRPA